MIILKTNQSMQLQEMSKFSALPEKYMHKLPIFRVSYSSLDSSKIYQM